MLLNRPEQGSLEAELWLPLLAVNRKQPAPEWVRLWLPTMGRSCQLLVASISYLISAFAWHVVYSCDHEVSGRLAVCRWSVPAGCMAGVGGLCRRITTIRWQLAII